MRRTAANDVLTLAVVYKYLFLFSLATDYDVFIPL